MSTPSNWQQFFDLQAETYEQNAFVQNSRVEAQFMTEVLDLKPGNRVLDIGSGTGRHARELADTGVLPTCLDFSPEMVRVGRQLAADRPINWICSDIREWSPDQEYDAAIMVCESPINLTGQGDEPVAHAARIFEVAAAALKPGGKLLCTALNAYAQVRQMRQEDVEADAFDPVMMTARYLNDMQLPTGSVTVSIAERLFFPPEIMALLHRAGFDLLSVWGGTAGEWGRRKIKLDEIEVMYFAAKR